jgi:hypothetical protein
MCHTRCSGVGCSGDVAKPFEQEKFSETTGNPVFFLNIIEPPEEEKEQ